MALLMQCSVASAVHSEVVNLGLRVGYPPGGKHLCAFAYTASTSYHLPAVCLQALQQAVSTFPASKALKQLQLNCNSCKPSPSRDYHQLHILLTPAGVS
jgi:hypothetical protein